MEKTLHGFMSNEVAELYCFLCIYENKLKHIGNQQDLDRKYPILKELEKPMSHFVCNNCTKASLNVIALVPMDNLVSMTKCRSSKILSFLHHLRNSIAHGQILLEDGFVHLIDYGYENKSKVFSARGKIQPINLFEILKVINENIELS